MESAAPVRSRDLAFHRSIRLPRLRARKLDSKNVNGRPAHRCERGYHRRGDAILPADTAAASSTAGPTTPATPTAATTPTATTVAHTIRLITHERILCPTLTPTNSAP